MKSFLLSTMLAGARCLSVGRGVGICQKCRGDHRQALDALLFRRRGASFDV